MTKLLRRLVLFVTLLFAVNAIAAAVNTIPIGQGGGFSSLNVPIAVCTTGTASRYSAQNTFTCAPIPATPSPSASATPTTSATPTPTTTPTALPAGIARGGAVALAFSELSGDAVTSGSNAVTVAKVNGNAPTTASQTHKFAISNDSSARLTLAQPACGDLSDAGPLCNATATATATASATPTPTATTTATPSATPTPVVPYAKNLGAPAVDATGSVSPFNLYTGTLAANTLGATGCVRFHAAGTLLYNNNTADTIDIKIIYNATAVAISRISGPALNATADGVFITGYMCNSNNTSAQFAELQTIVGNSVGLNGNGGSVKQTIVGVGVAAVASTSNQTLALTATLSSTSANDDLKIYNVEIEFIP